MPASLRMELFPKTMDACVEFYTTVLRFKVLKHEGTYAYLQRDRIFIGAVAGVPPHVPGKSVDEGSRRPPCGVEIVMEVDDVDEERNFVLERLGEGCLEEDLVERR